MENSIQLNDKSKVLFEHIFNLHYNFRFAMVAVPRCEQTKKLYDTQQADLFKKFLWGTVGRGIVPGSNTKNSVNANQSYCGSDCFLTGCFQGRTNDGLFHGTLNAKCPYIQTSTTFDMSIYTGHDSRSLELFKDLVFNINTAIESIMLEYTKEELIDLLIKPVLEDLSRKGEGGHHLWELTKGKTPELLLLDISEEHVGYRYDWESSNLQHCWYPYLRSLIQQRIFVKALDNFSHLKETYQNFKKAFFDVATRAQLSYPFTRTGAMIAMMYGLVNFHLESSLSHTPVNFGSLLHQSCKYNGLTRDIKAYREKIKILVDAAVMDVCTDAFQTAEADTLLDDFKHWSVKVSFILILNPDGSHDEKAVRCFLNRLHACKQILNADPNINTSNLCSLEQFNQFLKNCSSKKKQKLVVLVLDQITEPIDMLFRMLRKNKRQSYNRLMGCTWLWLQNDMEWFSKNNKDDYQTLVRKDCMYDEPNVRLSNIQHEANSIPAHRLNKRPLEKATSPKAKMIKK